MTDQPRIEALRDLFTQLDASEDHDNQGDWRALCALFEDWPEGEDLELALTYAREHSASWASWIKQAPESWAARFNETGREPRMRLVAMYEGEGDDELLMRIASSPDAVNFESIEIAYGDASSEGFRALATSPHLGKLRYIHLDTALIDDDDFEVLANSERRIETLVFNQALQLTDRALDLVRTAPAFENIDSLGFGEAFTGTDASVIALLDSERGRNLSGLFVGDMMTDSSLPAWIYEHQDELALVQLDLGQMWDVDWEIKEELAARYEMILE